MYHTPKTTIDDMRRAGTSVESRETATDAGADKTAPSPPPTTTSVDAGGGRRATTPRPARIKPVAFTLDFGKASTTGFKKDCTHDPRTPVSPVTLVSTPNLVQKKISDIEIRIRTPSPIMGGSVETSSPGRLETGSETMNKTFNKRDVERVPEATDLLNAARTAMANDPNMKKETRVLVSECLIRMHEIITELDQKLKLKNKGTNINITGKGKNQTIQKNEEQK